MLRKLPGLDPDQAADVIAKAIIQRPRAHRAAMGGAGRACLGAVGRARGSCRADLVPPILQRFRRRLKTSDDRKRSTTAARALLRSGLLSPPNPAAALVRLDRRSSRGGTNPYTLLAVAAARWPNRAAIIDDDGTLSYRELQSETETLAGSTLIGEGVGTRAGGGRHVPQRPGLCSCGVRRGLGRGRCRAGQYGLSHRRAGRRVECTPNPQ